MTTRNLVKIATIAALYAVFTILLAPISYGPVQFRVSEFFKIFVLFNPWLSIGIGIGTFFANLASPYIGPLELIWMPLTDIAGGVLAWKIFSILGNRLPAVPMVIYAGTTAAAVSAMLYILGMDGILLVALSVFISEAIILVGGLPLAKFISQRVNLE
ncbi:QueT transporter family protein [Chloroflexota bacterium]